MLSRFAAESRRIRDPTTTTSSRTGSADSEPASDSCALKGTVGKTKIGDTNIAHRIESIKFTEEIFREYFHVFYKRVCGVSLVYSGLLSDRGSPMERSWFDNTASDQNVGVVGNSNIPLIEHYDCGLSIGSLSHSPFNLFLILANIHCPGNRLWD